MSQTKKFDRSKFKDTVTVEQLKAQDSKVENLVERRSSGDYASFHKIEDGDNKFRIYPAHPNEEGHSFVQPTQCWWLDAEIIDKDDNGNEKRDKRGNVLKKMVRKKIFDARVHSLTGRDIVDEYIKFLTKILKEDGLSSEEITEKLLVIQGSYAKKVTGIVGKPTWIMYADRVNGSSREFGRLEVGKAVKLRINDLIARENADQPIGSEVNNPFTDPDDGRLLVITYNPDATKSTDYYRTELDASYDKTTKQLHFHPLSDEDLDKFMKYPTLHSLYVDSYTTRDFDFALNGLKLLDSKHEFGVFDYEEFIEIVEELSTLYPEYKEKEKQEEGVEEVSFEKMNRTQLKDFCKENKTGIIVKSTMSDDDIRQALYDWQEVNGKEEEEEEEEKEIKKPNKSKKVAKEEVEEEEEEEEDDLPFEKPKSKISDRIAKLRKNSK